MSQPCQTITYGSCEREAVALAVWTGCDHGVWYCAHHRDRAMTDSVTRDCSHGCGEDLPLKEMLGAYDGHRWQWLTHGGLASKDGMTDAVTLNVPANWDTYGSILAEPARPARRKLGELRLADTVGPFPVWVLGSLAVLAMVAAWVGIWTLLGVGLGWGT